MSNQELEFAKWIKTSSIGLLNRMKSAFAIQGNPSITDTIGNQHFIPYSEVSLAQGLPVYIQ